MDNQRLNPFEELLAVLRKLDDRKAAYGLAFVRSDGVMVTVAVPGQRWEIEFTRDSSIQVERFISDGTIHGPERLADLWALLD